MGKVTRTETSRNSKARAASSKETKGKPKRAASKRPAKRTLPAPTIEDAIELAVKSHRGQTDKYDQPYILHVLGVAGRCRSVEEKVVAFLHDVVEDTDTTFDDLRACGFSERIVAAVDCLTRRSGEGYDAFVERIAPNPLARAVKLADLEDNMDIRRSNRPIKEKDGERMEKYRKAWQYLAALHTDAGTPREE